MKVSIALTLDGMIRALRWKAHALADDIEHGYVDEGGKTVRMTTARSPLMRRETEDDRRE